MKMAFLLELPYKIISLPIAKKKKLVTLKETKMYIETRINR